MTPDEVDLLERGLQAYQYQYKPGMGEDGGTGQQHFGPMAQNLAQTEIGRGMVQQRPDGMLGIDGGRAGVTALGLAGDLHQRLKALEMQAGQQNPQAFAAGMQPEHYQAIGAQGYVTPETQAQLSTMLDQEDVRFDHAARNAPVDVKAAAAAGIPAWKAWTQGVRSTNVR